MKNRKMGGGKKGIRGVAGVLLLGGCLLFGGCAANELEYRTFPTLLTISDETDFVDSWLNGLQEGTKKVDYNHLKVILIEREFLEKEEKMEEMLSLLKEDKNVPLNAYVVTTDVLDELIDIETKLKVPLGDYMEQLLEHGDTVKKETYPTIGMLYQEVENRKETLFVPTISLVEEKPEVTSYEVYKRGIAIGQVESDVALLSFFINNQLEEYVLELGENHYVKLSDTKNRISFEKIREASGLLKHQVKVTVNCDGKILQQTNSTDDKEAWERLEAQLQEYMKIKAMGVLEGKADVTNSFKKLGEEREWYLYYMQFPDVYEAEIEMEFELDVAWIE